MTRIALSIALACVLAAPAATLAQRTESKDYKVGDRLPAAKKAESRAAQSGYREINWDHLIPKGWDPLAPLRGLNLQTLSDSDPKAIQAMEKLQAEWSKAPVANEMDNQRVRIPGFIVPLDPDREEIREFLLVPYFGACIHTPPPPSNQIIHVTATRPLKGFRSMEAVWVNGTLRTGRTETGSGTAGYKLSADAVAIYKPN